MLLLMFATPSHLVINSYPLPCFVHPSLAGTIPLGMDWLLPMTIIAAMFMSSSGVSVALFIKSIFLSTML